MSTLEDLSRRRDGDQTEAIQSLIDMMLATESAGRMNMLRQLGAMGTPASIAPLATALGDPEPSIRREALDCLRFINARWHALPEALQALPHLQRALRHPSYWARQSAAEAIARITGCRHGAVPVSPSNAPRQQTRSVVEILLDTVHDPHRNMRLACAEALARIGTPQAVAALKDYASDADPYVRRSASGLLHDPDR